MFTITMVGNADNCTVTSDSSVDLGVTAIKSPASGLDLTAAEGDLSLRGEFMRLVSGSDMDDDMKRAVLVAGIRALSGREADV